MNAEDAVLYRLRGVRKRFGESTVLDVPSLDIERGGIHFFVGFNGAGKTMMMRLLSLLEPPTEGEVIFQGGSLPGRKVTLVAQDPYLFDTTVLENAAYGLKRRGLPLEAAAEVLALVGLKGMEDRRARTLSGGEGKRLAIARALALRPEVLLLDEPLANVDAANIRVVEDLLREAGARLGATIVATTHEIDQAYRLKAKIVTLHQGRVVEAPPNNVFHGTAGEREGEWRVRIAEGVEVSVMKAAAGPACIGIDARVVVLSRVPADSSARNRYSGPISAMSLCGEHVQVTVDIGVPLSAWITPQSMRDLDLHVGDRVAASFKSASVRVF